MAIYSLEPDDTEESKLQLQTVEMQQNTEQSLQEPYSIAEAEQSQGLDATNEDDGIMWPS